MKSVIRSRRSLNPKSTDGRLSAIEGASVVYGACCGPEKDAPKRLGVAGMAAIARCVGDVSASAVGSKSLRGGAFVRLYMQ